MPETFASLLVKLARARVDYLVSGGVAVCLNGYLRTTQDLDLLVEPSSENLERLLACLADFGDGAVRELSASDFPLEEGAVRVIEDFTIDLFTILRGRTFAEFAPAARQVEIEGAAIRYLSPQSLIELKSASAREKDQVDAAVLRRILAGEVVPDRADLAELTPEDDSTSAPASEK